MPLTADQRREVNRENARNSTGPRTDEGKARSRRNALTHGLRAEVVALPHEDASAVSSRGRSWHDYYRPESPAARHLIDQCVQATLLADRCHRHHAAALTRQVRDAADDWDRRREDEVESLKALLATDPPAATRRLRRTADGCRWMIDEWDRLDAALREDGCWAADDRDRAIRLLGHHPETDRLKDAPDAFLTRFYNLMCIPNRLDSALAYLLAPERMPPSQRSRYAVDFLPDPEECRANLHAMTAANAETLRQEAARLAEDRDDPDRDGAADRASVLLDPTAARLFLRYHSESRGAFHRAYAALLRTLDRDRDQSDADADADSPEPEPGSVSDAAIGPDRAEASPGSAGPSPLDPSHACGNRPEPASDPGPETTHAGIFPNEPNPAADPAPPTARDDDADGDRPEPPIRPDEATPATGPVEGDPAAISPNEPNPAADPAPPPPSGEHVDRPGKRRRRLLTSEGGRHYDVGPPSARSGRGTGPGVGESVAVVPAKDFKKRMVVEIDGAPHIIEQILVQTPSARGAATLYKVRARNLKSKARVEKAYRGTDALSESSFERRPVQFLYRDAEAFHFMDAADFNQFSFPLEELREIAPFLTENMGGVESLVVDEEVIAVELPDAVDLPIVETAPGVRGNSATGRTKPATLSTGHVVQVPEHLEAGVLARVDTRTGEYLGRVN